MKRYIEKFLQYIQSKTSSRWTFLSYKSHLKTYEEWIELAKKDFKNLNFLDTEEFISYIQLKDLSNRSVNTILSSLRSFYKYLEKQGICRNIWANVEGPKQQKRLIHPLTQQEIYNLFNEVKNKDYRIAFLLMLYAGLRVGEVVKLKRDNFIITNSPEYPLQIQVIGKGNKERITYIIDKLIEKEVIMYIRDKKDYIFPFKTENSLVKYAGKIKSVKNFHSHRLRHTFATRLLERGVKIEIISKLLGHENIQTTMIYAEVSPKIIERELSAQSKD